MIDRLQSQQHPLPFDITQAIITVLCGIITVYALHAALVYIVGYPILSPVELCWNALVFLTPTPLLLSSAKRQELRKNDMLAQTHAAKSETLRKILAMGGGGASLTHIGGEGLMSRARRMSGFGGGREDGTAAGSGSDMPPGLGNWDNSCYQNSVLQGLSSLPSLRSYLATPRRAGLDPESTTGSLYQTVQRLSGAENNGKQLWTPAKLKNMSSWQQQDAQEYFSKIMDELDKEAAHDMMDVKVTSGLEAIVQGDEQVDSIAGDAPTKNPLEGLLAQRVACTRCGYSDGLSMIPFNCLTVPLGSEDTYDLEQCLDEYMKLEEITDVDCAKCTLLRAETQLKQMVPPEAKPKDESVSATVSYPYLNLPPEVRIQVIRRLEAIQQALETDDFADITMNETCQIPKKAHVSSTKTRQAVIGRAPPSLVIHMNRSVFEELTGVQRKNYATVRYPMVLNLAEWMPGPNISAVASTSILDSRRQESAEKCLYRLKAVIQHYGRHENGHYIAYRRHPKWSGIQANGEGKDDESNKEEMEQWWRLSDEDVSVVSEAVALGQGGVFMLFYEREEMLPVSWPMEGEKAITASEHAAVDAHEIELSVTSHVDADADGMATGEPRPAKILPSLEEPAAAIAESTPLTTTTVHTDYEHPMQSSSLRPTSPSLQEASRSPTFPTASSPLGQELAAPWSSPQTINPTGTLVPVSSICPPLTPSLPWPTPERPAGRKAEEATSDLRVIGTGTGTGKTNRTPTMRTSRASRESNGNSQGLGGLMRPMART
ncbi:hypothetical protein LTR62_000116 [Meristemomyces frigidus]|uniref:ubiquitinyl hydrolase 1 n=1 Tax=Meristemomyces frigidus TaxID=1508187 RepID=A0AAN7TJ44_9PEZI|nr:hypothetical protein LTR62_000116 [Meristemomyces frigidus]